MSARRGWTGLCTAISNLQAETHKMGNSRAVPHQLALAGPPPQTLISKTQLWNSKSWWENRNEGRAQPLRAYFFFSISK